MRIMNGDGTYTSILINYLFCFSYLLCCFSYLFSWFFFFFFFFFPSPHTRHCSLSSHSIVPILPFPFIHCVCVYICIRSAEKKVWFAAGRSIKKGEEIFNAYGSSSFTKMMPQYGFMDPLSPLDRLHETFSFPDFPLTPDLVAGFTTTPLGHMYRNASDPAGRGQNRFQVDYRQHNVTSMLPFVRIGVFSSGKKLEDTTQEMRDAVTKKAMCTGKPDFKTCGISKANEAVAVRKLREHLVSLRNEYSSPLKPVDPPMREIVDRIAVQLRERAAAVLEIMIKWIDENGVYASEDIEANSGLLVQKAPKK